MVGILKSPESDENTGGEELMYTFYEGSHVDSWGPCEIIDEDHPRWLAGARMHGRYTIVDKWGRTLIHVRPESILLSEVSATVDS